MAGNKKVNETKEVVTMVWTTGPEGGRATLKVNGSQESVQPGDSFVEAVKTAADRAGLRKFNVFLNGRRIDPEDAPASVREGDSIDVQAYDVAA